MSPKLSDSLRAMAERAPLGEARLNPADAAQRVRRHRLVYRSANTLVGLGAVAVVAFAVWAPPAGTGGLGAAAQSSGPGMAEPDQGYADALAAERSQPAECGMPYEAAPSTTPAVLTVTPAVASLTDGQDAWTVAVTRLVTQDVDAAVTSVRVRILWEGLTVGYATEAAGGESAPWRTGDTAQGQLTVQAVNCWDGAPLPAGEYQVAVMQTIEWPEDPAQSKDVGTVVLEGAGPDTPVEAPSAVMHVQMLEAEPVTVTVPGVEVPQPFAAYLNAAPTLPEGYLTPALAREVYAAHLTDTPWDMAPGTQRVVAVSDTAQGGGGEMPQYFGCTWDGSMALSFPARSSTWDLVTVDGALPQSIDVSHGFVVDGNPEFWLSIANTSGYTMASGSGPTGALVLVRDGVVVAEAMGTPLEPYGGMVEPLPQNTSLLQSFLWRDVNACGGTAHGPLAAGTYTVLAVEYVSVTNAPGQMVAMYSADGGTSWVSVDGSSGGSSGSTGASGGAPTVEVYPITTDAVDFQVWHSLGTVTVSLR